MGKEAHLWLINKVALKFIIGCRLFILIESYIFMIKHLGKDLGMFK